MKRLILSAIILITALCQAFTQNIRPHGTTQNLLFPQSVISVGQAERYAPPIQQMMEQSSSRSTAYDQWRIRDSIYFDTYIPAGANIGVKFNSGTRRLEFVSPRNSMTPEAKSAIKKSPAWLRPALEHTLSLLQTQVQIEYANVINNAVDPFIDEIAFSIAQSSAEFLSSNYCYPDLFIENAQSLYANDKVLPYVEIVDHGTSTTDENYYSTVRYWKMDSTFNKVQIEVPRDVYYWYLVHPKTSDELSTYVDPNLAEDNSNHTTTVTPPPQGVFWRDYIFKHTELNPDTTGIYFPVLKDELAKCDILWADKDTLSQAVRSVAKWIKSVMTFGSGTERPHQPLRIYDLHLGRCGEHEDITNAAARAALIPDRGIETYSNDHVWNEFWDEQWCMWEPTNYYYKTPLVYENGWGKVFGSVIARRSDGVYIPVSDVYSQGSCKINVYALDPNNKPIDGASILLFIADGTNIIFDNYGITDNDGKFTFVAGEGKTYYARMNSSLGNNPPQQNQVFQLILNAVDKQEYSFQIKSSQAKQFVNYHSVAIPRDDSTDYVLKIDFKADEQVIHWQNLFDDLNTATTSYIFPTIPSGKISFFITDENNYTKSTTNTLFDASNVLNKVGGGNISFDIPISQSWYAFLNNRNNMNNLIHAKGSFVLLVAPNVNAVEQPIAAAHDIQLGQNYPNPIIASSNGNSITDIRYSLSHSSHVSLIIYDYLGREIQTLDSGFKDSGDYSIRYNVNNLPSGMYFYRLYANGSCITRKMNVVK